jgi:arsenite/tail-anchored protein-transporting ATPase
VGGKGGVGKTTVAAALAVELADAGEQVLVISVDPAHSLGDALEVELGPEPRSVVELPDLRAMEVDAGYERERFLQKHGDDLAKLIERGTYLDVADVAEVTNLTVPGMDELAAMLRLAVLATDFAGHVVVDTAPTGHTLRLLELPRIALNWLGALEAMQAKHVAVVWL